jgi:hypothetical protein
VASPPEAVSTPTPIPAPMPSPLPVAATEHPESEPTSGLTGQQKATTPPQPVETMVTAVEPRQLTAVETRRDEGSAPEAAETESGQDRTDSP